MDGVNPNPGLGPDLPRLSRITPDDGEGGGVREIGGRGREVEGEGRREEAEGRASDRKTPLTGKNTRNG